MSKKNKYGLSSADYAKLYDVWRHFCERCHKSGTKEYEAYGGRGISVCDEWRTNFSAFSDWAIENGWKPGLTIERINVDDGYSPRNCKFVTPREQTYNLQSSVYIEINGVKKSLPEWCDIFGIRRGMAINRINRGETDPERIFFKGNMRDFGRRIVQKDAQGNLIQVYPNAREASDSVGISLSAIHNCCRGLCKTSGGYIWEYKFEKENSICRSYQLPVCC